jgi:hypothetical protein
VDLRASALNIKAKERLPVQDLLERESLYHNEPMTSYQEEAATQGQPHTVPYSFLDLPMVDLYLDLDQYTQPTASSAEGSVELGGDLLWMSSDIYLDRSEGSWGNSRGTLFRESPDGGLLGPMKARRVELGDLYTVPTMDLVGALPQGRGLNISNYPLNYSVRFATKTFRGPLPVGWSVEFFQNGSLVGYQPPTGTGVYLFQDVPLRFGINLFQLVFHGPLGEVREVKYRLDISQDQPAPGAFYYGVAGVQPRADEVDALLPYGTADSALVKPSYMVHADYGLSTAFSVQGGAAGMEQVNGFNSYAMMGVRGVWSFLALQMTAAQDQGVNPTPGTGLEWVLSTGNAYSTLTVRRDQFLNGFQRSIYDSADLGAIGYQVKDATGVDLNWTLNPFRIPLSLSAQVDEENYVGGAEGTRERIILSTHALGVNLSNSITRLTLPQQPNPLQGDLMATMFKTGWSWQGNLYYDQDRLTGWGAQAQFNGPQGYQYSCGAIGPVGSTYAVDSPGPVQINAGVQRLTGRWGFGLNLQKTGSTYAGYFQLQVSLGREPRTGKWVSDAQSLATTGSVSAIAFQDTNGNGVRDPGEPTIPGAKFQVGGTGATNQVQDPAVTFITKLAPSQPVDVSLDESSLEDTAQKAAVKAFTIVPRPGKVERLEFPVVFLGDVNGVTRIHRGGKQEEMPGLEVELLDASGKRVRATRSAYDGFFEFRDIPFGEYLLRVTPEEIARVGLKPSAPRRILIQPARHSLDGMDLIVEPLEESSEPSVERSSP